MYYINFIFLYSVLGFVLESVVYKFNETNSHSGIFLGPINLTYGIGMFLCYLVYRNLNLVNNIFSYLIYYLIFIFLTSLIEFLFGHIIYYLLHIDKWNYSNYKYHFGKYLCLNNSLIWGILAILFVYFFNPYLSKNIILTIPNKFTIFLLFIFSIDLIYLIYKIVKKNRN